jgi:hypothetical protein
MHTHITASQKHSVRDLAENLTENVTEIATSSSSANLSATQAATTGLYDLWLNSMLPTVSPSMVTGVTSSSSHQIANREVESHQIDSERLAEKLLQLCINESASTLDGNFVKA